MPAAPQRFLFVTNGLDTVHRLPFGFAHDYSRSQIGRGQSAFAAARLAFRRWAMFDLGWVRVANSKAIIVPGQVVAVEAHTLGMWSLSLSRITEVIDTPTRFGFVYLTTKMHVEEGEERFLLVFDPENGELFYELEAVSRPRNALARLGFPFTRHFQRRFARDSHRRILKEIVAPEADA